MRIGQLSGLVSGGFFVLTLFAGSAVAAEEFSGWDDDARRDPFDFREPRPDRLVENEEEDEKEEKMLKRNGRGIIEPDQWLVEALACERICLAHLRAEAYERAAEETQATLEDLKLLGHKTTAVFERLNNINGTASRLHHRSQIEKRLRELPINLQGIVWSDTNPVALIDGVVRRKGDVISGVRIESIGRSGIVLEMDEVRVQREFGRQASGQ